MKVANIPNVAAVLVMFPADVDAIYIEVKVNKTPITI